MRRSKYNAKPCEIDGLRFDSLLEGRRYKELRLLERAGRIENLAVHPVFELRAYDGRSGTVVGSYEADASYWEVEEPGCSRFVVEDCKGVITPLARWKLKHFESQYGMKVRIVKRARC